MKNCYRIFNAPNNFALMTGPRDPDVGQVGLRSEEFSVLEFQRNNGAELEIVELHSAWVIADKQTWSTACWKNHFSATSSPSVLLTSRTCLVLIVIKMRTGLLSQATDTKFPQNYLDGCQQTNHTRNNCFTASLAADLTRGDVHPGWSWAHVPKALQTQKT